MELSELKRKLRQLKKLEAKIRFEGTGINKPLHYIWDDFFSLKEENKGSVKYRIQDLLKMDHPNLKEIFEEYFYYVYYQHDKENGITREEVFDPKLLAAFGLPPDASLKDIKSKFRDLAKKHHPDHGGDSSKFIALYQTYEKLVDHS